MYNQNPKEIHDYYQSSVQSQYSLMISPHSSKSSVASIEDEGENVRQMLATLPVWTEVNT